MSMWWIVGAFVLGGSAGVLLFALMSMAAINHSSQTVDPEDRGPRQLRF